jgi:hypothetical protein
MQLSLMVLFFEDEDQNVVTKEEMQSYSFTLEKFRSWVMEER